jgi:prepilin-type N-terminal cleavage/methylation domain-containing protein
MNRLAPFPPRRAPAAASARAARAAFTLIELLVVMVVIAILSSMVLAALYSANESAKLSKTKATIAKIHAHLAERWDSYRTRRLPLRMIGPQVQNFAQVRLQALWMLQRLEMPDDYSEIFENGDVANGGRFDPTAAPGGLPVIFENLKGNALQEAYFRTVRGAYNTLVLSGRTDAATLITGPNASAECLYLTIALGADEDVRLTDGELGDTDQDGIKEIIDGWGRPIRWIRWAPGYVPRLGADSDFQRDDPPGSAAPMAFQPDPFDPRGVCRPGGAMGTPPGMPASGTAWGFKLMPLVFSAGPDGEYSISGLRAQEPGPSPNYEPSALPAPPTVAWHPYSYHIGKWRGTPVAGLEGGGHLDNITNHRLGTR